MSDFLKELDRLSNTNMEDRFIKANIPGVKAEANSIVEKAKDKIKRMVRNGEFSTNGSGKRVVISTYTIDTAISIHEIGMIHVQNQTIKDKYQLYLNDFHRYDIPLIIKEKNSKNEIKENLFYGFKHIQIFDFSYNIFSEMFFSELSRLLKMNDMQYKWYWVFHEYGPKITGSRFYKKIDFTDQLPSLYFEYETPYADNRRELRGLECSIELEILLEF